MPQSKSHPFRRYIPSQHDEDTDDDIYIIQDSQFPEA